MDPDTKRMLGHILAVAGAGVTWYGLREKAKWGKLGSGLMTFGVWVGIGGWTEKQYLDSLPTSSTVVITEKLPTATITVK